MTSPSETDTSRRSIKRWLNRLLWSGGVAAVPPLVFPIVSGGLLLVQARLIAHILDGSIAEGIALGDLATPLIALSCVLLARIGLGLGSEAAAVVASERIKQRLRAALADLLFRRLPIWTAAHSSGALSSTIIEQVDALDGYLVRYIPAMVQASFLPMAFAAVIFPIDWMVGVILLVTTPLIPLFMALVGWGAEAATARQAEALTLLSGRFADRLRGLTTLKLFGRAAAETADVATASEELRHRTMRVMRIAFLSSAVLEFFAALGVAGVALYIGLTFLGLVSLRGGVSLSLEAGLFCLLMAPDVYAPLRLLAANYHDAAAAKAAAAEIETQFDALPDSLSPPDRNPIAATVRHGPASLDLCSVDISTPDGRPVIEGADLAISPGQSVAMLGSSGIGKSTLLEAIARLRDYSGEIAINGEPLRGVPETRLRARVAMLGQRPHMFPGTIVDNIRLGRRNACDTAVRVAARRARVSDFADGLPDGLATPIGEDGLGLSGGEIQRIALARIYLRDPGLILLDEPTAHLDPLTERHVLDGLFEFARGRTLLVATHSEAVAARAQRVYRIAAGRLIPALHPAVPAPFERRGVA